MTGKQCQLNNRKNYGTSIPPINTAIIIELSGQYSESVPKHINQPAADLVDKGVQAGANAIARGVFLRTRRNGRGHGRGGV